MQYLLGFMLALTLSLMALTTQFTTQAQQHAATKQTATAQQAQAILTAAHNYIASNPSGLPSTSASAPVNVALSALVNPPGNLFAGYTAPPCNTQTGCPNPYGQTWTVQVLCTYAACPQTGFNPHSGPWTSFLLSTGGTPIPDAALPGVADLVGAAGGNTPVVGSNPNLVQGAYGGWSFSFSGTPALTNPGPGHLVCQVN